jgi:hypothetical protein
LTDSLQRWLRNITSCAVASRRIATNTFAGFQEHVALVPGLTADRRSIEAHAVEYDFWFGLVAAIASVYSACSRRAC